MKFPCLPFLAVISLLLSLNASAQETPPVYCGPYQLPHVGQFAGEWLRSDGTYRMEVSVEGDVVKAQYFNPKAIQVETTTVVREADTMLLKVVLRDEGYPGSTYQLQYLPQYRVLLGSYTIPGQAPTEVYFTQ